MELYIRRAFLHEKIKVHEGISRSKQCQGIALRVFILDTKVL